MVQVSIIGSGNLAQHLARAFSQSDSAQLVQVLARDPGKVVHLAGRADIISDAADLKPADLIIIAVSDSAVSDVAMNLPFTGKLVAHTAGSLPTDVLGNRNRAASFYPLQTFSKERSLDLSRVPIFIETADPSDAEILRRAANAISDEVHTVDAKQRLALHVAAVFVCNFVNHLYHVGQRICEDNQLDFSLLEPLISETASKVMELNPELAQTGPAKRKDYVTIDRHREFLGENHMRSIYELFTKSIIEWK